MCAALLGLMLVCSTRIFPAGICDERFLVGGESSRQPGAIDLDVEIAGRRNLHLGDAFDGPDLGANGFGDLQRSRTQRLGEGKESGMAKSPSSTLGGCSMTTSGRVDARITALQTLRARAGQNDVRDDDTRSPSKLLKKQ